MCRAAFDARYRRGPEWTCSARNRCGRFHFLEPFFFDTAKSYPTRSATLEPALAPVFSPTTRTGREEVATRTAFPHPSQNRNDVTAEASPKTAKYKGMAILPYRARSSA